MMEGDDEEMLEASDDEDESQEEEQAVNDEHAQIAQRIGGIEDEQAAATLAGGAPPPPPPLQNNNLAASAAAVDAADAPTAPSSPRTGGDTFAAPDAPGVKASEELARMIAHRKSLAKKLASLDVACNKKLVECADATRGGLAVGAYHLLTIVPRVYTSSQLLSCSINGSLLITEATMLIVLNKCEHCISQ
jgi:hypothetical protein